MELTTLHVSAPAFVFALSRAFAMLGPGGGMLCVPLLTARADVRVLDDKRVCSPCSGAER